MADDPVRKKIAALLRMTGDAGCSEAEALAAAEKAAELMREHGLSEADVTFGQARVRTTTSGGGVRDPLWAIVGYCTNTAATFLARPRGGADLTYVGADPGPEIAAYLVSVLNRAINAAVSDFKASRFYRRRRSDATRRAAVRDFTAGMASRLGRRLIEMFASSIDKQARSKAVAVRNARFPDLVTVTGPSAEVRFGEAHGAGWGAGGRVGLAHGVNGGSAAPRQIGGR